MKLTKKHIAIIFIIILLLQILARIYLGFQKEYFHMDEAYSYGLMNYNKLNITDNEDFLNNWHNKEYYVDYLAINENEKLNFSAVYENQKNDVHPPLYYLLLRLSATFTIDHFSKWTGLTLNIIIFLISSIFVYLISKKLFKSRIYSLLVCLINGFTLISLDSSLYIRMYELSNLNILIITYLHLRINDKKELKFKNLLFITIALILGGLTHYYYFVYALGIYICYLYKYATKKEYKNLIRYNLAIIIAAVIYLLIFPYAINHILFGYRGVGKEITRLDFTINFVKYLFILDEGICNCLFVIIICAVYLICRKRKIINAKKDNKIIFLVLPIFLYLIMISKNSPYIESRYVMRDLFYIHNYIYIYIKNIYSKVLQ